MYILYIVIFKSMYKKQSYKKPKENGIQTHTHKKEVSTQNKISKFLFLSPPVSEYCSLL